MHRCTTFDTILTQTTFSTNSRKIDAIFAKKHNLHRCTFHDAIFAEDIARNGPKVKRIPLYDICYRVSGNEEALWLRGG